jgi:phenylpropionate dioxygenase-like ring-hydroxylating dioxygenase large terminal subunit
MLSKQENDLLCRVGPGTPMGNLLREYWFPAMPSYELPSPDCPPKKLRLLGEDLVAFRDSAGRVGIVAQACPHRGASLFFGRNEEEGLRCVYHGWKFDVEGICVDMPSEPAESNFKSKVRVRAYPARDVNHMVWTYMGPRETPPPFPRFEVLTLPPEQVNEPSIMMEEANWFQNLEGDIDSSHIDYLHSRVRLVPPGSDELQGFLRDRAPRLTVMPTDYGAFYSAKRQWDNEGNYWHRISQFIFPFHTMIAASNENSVSLRSFVPLDDHYAMLISQNASLVRPISDEQRARTRDAFSLSGGYVTPTSDPRTRYFTTANKSNDYARDFEVERTSQFCGIPFAGNLQDRAMTELMTNEDGIEPIYDRSKEHLGSTDSMIITVRRLLIRAARAHQEEGRAPANVDNVELDRVRSCSVILPADADWIAESEAARNSDAGVPVAYVQDGNQSPSRVHLRVETR